jgi:hypothetical protein
MTNPGHEGLSNGDNGEYLPPHPLPHDEFTMWFTHMLALEAAHNGGLISDDEFSAQREDALNRWEEIPQSHLGRLGIYEKHTINNYDSEELDEISDDERHVTPPETGEDYRPSIGVDGPDN